MGLGCCPQKVSQREVDSDLPWFPLCPWSLPWIQSRVRCCCLLKVLEAAGLLERIFSSYGGFVALWEVLRDKNVLPEVSRGKEDMLNCFPSWR